MNCTVFCWQNIVRDCLDLYLSFMLRFKKNLWIYSIAVLGESILAGWLLSQYQASWWAWVGTCAVSLHLAWAGFDAIAVGLVWIISLVWIGAFAGSWFKNIPWVKPGVWAAALAVVGIFGLILILTLAQARKVLLAARWGQTQVFWLLAIASWLGLWLGWLVDRIFFPQLR
jgi:hypothetical protein